MVGIWTEEIPESQGLAAQGLAAYPTSLGEVLGAVAADAWTRNPSTSIARWLDRRQYWPSPAGGDDPFAVNGQLPATTPAPMLSVEEANRRFGIDKHLSFTEPTPEPVAQDLHDLKRAELARADIIARGPGGGAQTLGSLGVGFALGVADPLNLASAFLPVVGSARAALWLAEAGSAGARAVVRGAIGAAEGLAGAALVEPIVAGVAHQEQADYTAVDSMLNLAFGTVLGGGLHAGLGAIGDRWASGRGRPAGYERDLDAAVQSRLSGDMTQPDDYVRRGLAAFGASDAPVLERALAAARPETREALLRAALAQTAQGRPVAVEALARMDPALRGEMFEVGRVIDAAQADPLGPMDSVIARLSPEGLEQILLQKGQALLDPQGSLLVQGKRHQAELGKDGSRGAVKILFKHGPLSDKAGGPEELTRADILAMPNVVRTYEPSMMRTHQQTGEVMEQSWEVRRSDGAQVRYSVNRNDSGDLLTATIHVRRGGTEGPLSIKRAAPDASPRGGSSRDTADGIPYTPPKASGTPPPYTRTPRRGQDRGLSVHAPQAIYDGAGRRLMVRYELAEAADLVASHGDDLAPNPAFPAELQPRDRTRAAAEAQIHDIVSRFEPERLLISPDAATGAPVVGPDHVVESGNGRVIALRRVLAAGGEDAARYRAALASLGFDPRPFSDPVLVRRRLDDLAPDERRAFTVAAQKSGTLELSATERAMADAQRLDGILHLLDGDPALARNAPFVREFARVLPQSEQGAMTSAGGDLSREGRRRIEAALLARAYDNADLLGRMLETDDDNSRALIGALLDVAPDWAAMRAAAARGDISPHVDATADLVAAVRAVRDARASGRPLAEIAAQADMFGGRTARADRFLGLMLREDGDGRVRTASRAEIAGDLRRYVDQAEQSHPVPDMFGSLPATAGDLLSLVGRDLPGEGRPGPIFWADRGSTPVTVYHGTNKNFSEFDPSKLGEFTGANSAKEGFFFTTNRKVADDYAFSSSLEGENRFWKTPKGQEISKWEDGEIVRLQEEARATKGPNAFPDWDAVEVVRAEARKRRDEAIGGNSRHIVGAKLSISNPAELDAAGQDARRIGLTKAILKAKEAGHDALVVRNVQDNAWAGNEVADVIVVFDKKNIHVQGRETGGDWRTSEFSILAGDPEAEALARINRTLDEGRNDPAAAGAMPPEDDLLDADILRAVETGHLAADDPDLAAIPVLSDAAQAEGRMAEAWTACRWGGGR